MGLCMSVDEIDQYLNNPSKMAKLLMENGVAAHTNRLVITAGESGKCKKKPMFQWKNGFRNDSHDSCLFINTGKVVVIDIDTKIEDIRKNINLPSNCWLETTPSGGVHIYFLRSEKLHKYNNCIKISLFGIHPVDILIKNSIVYAGGSTYLKPNGDLCRYVWDKEMNPLTTTLGKMPEEWESMILEILTSKDKEVAAKMRPYLLGCQCCKPMGIELTLVSSIIARFGEECRSLIREWTASRDISIIVEECLQKYSGKTTYRGDDDNLERIINISPHKNCRVDTHVSAQVVVEPTPPPASRSDGDFDSSSTSDICEQFD